MTNEEFASWCDRHFRSRLACSKAMGLDRDTVDSLVRGATRKGTPYPVSTTVALACAAWTLGLRDYDGGAVTLGGQEGAK